MDQIIRHPNIWDLHIHTPLGKGKQPYYDGDATSTFVDKLIQIYKEAPNPVGMISFTDHNGINAEAYELFRSKTDVAIIPGIEMDVYLLETDQYSKHIIFYFDEGELDNIRDLKKIVEDYINCHQKVIFESFVMELISYKKKFVLSPHAFKQGKRGINYEWIDEKSAEKGHNRFAGLFFPFWEAGGKSDICKAIEFLNEMGDSDDNTQAVIAFSDSSDYQKLIAYIEKPHQYFCCLNSFRGLLMAGSDPGRVIYDLDDRPGDNPSEKIKKIEISDNLKQIRNNNKIEVELSDRLNVIIGGRGTGKSALLDAIVYAIDPGKIQDRGRKIFAEKFHTNITNFQGHRMPSDTNIVYFSQSYINKLFDGDSREQLEKFFSNQFNQNDNLSYSMTDVVRKMEEGNQIIEIDNKNVSDDLLQLKYLDKKAIYPNIRKLRKKMIPLYNEQGNIGYKSVIRQNLPEEPEIWDEEVSVKLDELIELLLKNIAQYNYRQMLSKEFSEIMRKQCSKYKKKRDLENQKKENSRERIEQKLRFLYNQELTRMRQINRLYRIDVQETDLSMCYSRYDGDQNNEFFFVNVSNKEHPVQFARRVIIQTVNRTRQRGFEKKTNEEIFGEYALGDCFEEKMKDNTSFEELIDTIGRCEGIRHEKRQFILYKTGNDYIDLHKTSPGMQTNAVMEFILHTDSTIPLFLDQPEDNIDNRARYNQLTKWIRSQKYQRQIILVTHDANIVINGDAECVIIAEHTSEKFKYEYGALEYGDILDQAAEILDGGKVAIHRRMEKYGE